MRLFNNVFLTPEQTARFVALWRSDKYTDDHYQKEIFEGVTYREHLIVLEWERQEIKLVDVPGEYYCKYMALWKRWGQKRFKQWAQARVWKDRFYKGLEPFSKNSI